VCTFPSGLVFSPRDASIRKNGCEGNSWFLGWTWSGAEDFLVQESPSGAVVWCRGFSLFPDARRGRARRVKVSDCRIARGGERGWSRPRRAGTGKDPFLLAATLLRAAAESGSIRGHCCNRRPRDSVAFCCTVATDDPGIELVRSEGLGI
jgi:hypothetical protein